MLFPAVPFLYLKNNLFTTDGTSQFQYGCLGYSVHLTQLADSCSIFSSQGPQRIAALDTVINRFCSLSC